MKITRSQLRKLINETVIGNESYPVNFPPNLKKPGMRAICIWRQMAPGDIKLTFLQNPEFGDPNFARIFKNDLKMNESHIEIPPPPRSPAAAQIVIQQPFLGEYYEDPFTGELKADRLNQWDDIVGNVLDMLRTPRPGFIPFTHIIDIEDMYDARFIGELNDAAIQRYSPGWTPDVEEDSFSDEWV
jgi:hypothetical protein